MHYWICTTCGTQFAQSAAPPQDCPICRDKRQYIGHNGQQWTTRAALQKDGLHNTFMQHEANLIGISTEPTFAIRQWALLVQTAQRNVRLESIRLLDE